MALVLLVLVLVATTGTAYAAPTDPVTVPDASFKAIMNNAIAATAPVTTRTADQTITEADAERVTTINDVDFGAPGPADFTGAEALKNVTEFTLTRGSGTATSLQPFAGLTKLTTLAIWNSAISSLSPISGLTNLTDLTIRSAKLTGLQGISTLKNLVNVNFDINRLAAVPELASLPNLQVVVVSNNQIKDLSPLAGLTTLTNVTAESNQLTDVDFIKDLKNLVTLNASKNRIIDISVFEQVPTFPQSGHKIRATNSRIDLRTNRIRDLTALGIYPGSANQDNNANRLASQSLYVGPYKTGGITLDPKPLGPRLTGTSPGEAPTISSAGTGTYTPATGLLTLANPAAPSIQLKSGAQIWTVFFSEDPAKQADLKLNEVESDGDTVNGDWLELYNPTSAAIDAAGLAVSDNDNTHLLKLPADSTVPAKGYAAFRTDDPAVTGNFDLGAADSVRVFPAATTLTTIATTAIANDSYAWTAHATTTYGRTVPGAGVWSTTDHGTRAAENVFPPPVVIPTVVVTGSATSTDGKPALTATVRKPGSTDVATTATGTVVFSVDGQAVSGPVAVSAGVAQWTPSAALSGSPTGTAHTVTAKYVSAGASDPYNDSAGGSPAFTVTVTILEFGNASIAVSTQTPSMCQPVVPTISGWGTTPPDTITYQWQVQDRNTLNWTSALGAGKTQATFTPGFTQYLPASQSMFGDFGTYRLQVTGTKAGYATKTVAGPSVSSKQQTQFTATPAATLDVTAPKVGQKVTGTHVAWSSCLPSNYDGTMYDYQWLRDGQPIADATDTITGNPKQVSYTPTAADAGHVLALKVSVVGNTYTQDASVTSTGTARVADGAFTASSVPAIDNVSPNVGETLRATAGTWAPVAAFAYQWLRDGLPIAGATDVTYTTVVADFGTAVSVRVTGAATGYVATEKTSAVTAKVAETTFTTAPVPTIDNGSPKVGDTLKASTGTWSPVAELTYQWLRDGRPVTGATGATYPATAADLNYAISVQVTGHSTGYTTATKTSAATSKVIPAPVVDVPKEDPPVQKPPVQDPPVQDPPQNDPPKSTTVKPSITLAAVKGGKVKVTMTVKGLAKALISPRATVKIAGIKASIAVSLKQGAATFKLPAKARAAKKARITVSAKQFTKKAGTTTYLVQAASKTATVSVR